MPKQGYHTIFLYYQLILSMDIIHGYQTWILSMDISHGHYPWKSPTDNMHGYYPWITFMEIIHRYHPWIVSPPVGQANGRGAKFLHCLRATRSAKFVGLVCFFLEKVLFLFYQSNCKKDDPYGDLSFSWKTNGTTYWVPALSSRNMAQPFRIHLFSSAFLTG